MLTFGNCLKENNTLHQLIISWNDIYLDLNSNAASLDVSNKQFGNIGAILLLAFLLHNTNMQALDIYISNEGAVYSNQ